MDFNFRKEERLIHRKSFEELIQTGKIYFSHPLRISYCITQFESNYPVRVAFAVPKKKYKRANKRNILKRRMREAYRLNKNGFYETLTKRQLKLSLLIVYIGNEICTYKEIEKKLVGFFNFIDHELSKMAQ